MSDLFGNNTERDELPEQPRQCWHCGATEDDGVELWEAYCNEGQGLLHCEECSEECEECQEVYCTWELGFVDTPDGILKVCEECKKEIERAK